MPQESLRSVVYRSFVTCKDPRGVVEGKTIKISKTDSTEMSSRRIESKLQPQSSKEKEKMSLVEVNNGAQKLNETIDSWSKGANYRGQTKDIAKDLLKGALDLQESLMMLGKLQETSYITNLKKKQEKTSGKLSSRIGSDRFESFQLYDAGYEKERKLANGSSRDCYAELRDVIREGLSKQNLLPNKSSYQESAFIGRDTQGLADKRKLHLSPDLASTSSTRSSSMVYSTHEFTSSDSFSSQATEEKSKGSNLIAKLMGLDEFPSKSIPSSPRKQLDITSKIRPAFDVDLPNAKKPHFSVQKVNREHMSLDEIIEMMQYKGLFRSNKRESKQTSKSYRDDSPPIVLIKPHRLGSDNQKFKVYDNPIRKLHQEKAKSGDVPVKIRGKMKSPSNNQKVSVPVVAKPQRKHEMEKKVDKVQKIAPRVKKKPVENAKSATLVSQNDSLKQKRNVLSDSITKRTSSTVSSTNKSSNYKKNPKIEKPTEVSFLKLDVTVEMSKIRLISSPNQNKTQDFEVTFKEVDNVSQPSLCKAFEEDSDCAIDAVSSTSVSETINNGVKTDVFAINEQKARILQSVTNFQDSEQLLYQDCVDEFLDLENQRQNPLGSMLQSRICNFEDQTLGEIVKGIESLKSYSMYSKESSNADTLFKIMERDIYSSTINGGWKDGCTINEVEEVVLDLEKMVLSKLIDDMLMELQWKWSQQHDYKDQEHEMQNPLHEVASFLIKLGRRFSLFGLAGRASIWVCNGKPCTIINVYGPHNDPDKARMWDSLSSYLQKYEDEACVVCGDFNEVRNQDERLNCEFIASRARKFNEFIVGNSLIDLPMGGRKFTRVSEDGLKFSKLDRFLVNDNFNLMWSNLSVTALERSLSDHCPIVLKDLEKNFGPKPTRVFDEWLKIDGIEDLFKASWDEEISVGSRSDCVFRNKLKRLKLLLKDKCNNMFGEY
ncbi:uncharacterized protein [Rutidosis leptorrhynchoides]|uniref:uncharacterized protein n=1 Tax=Rutidosis leptorrhynchoides TaxID=125765 RepID=UPI003A993709